MGCLLCFLYYFIIFLIIVKIYLKATTGWCKSQVCLVGKTAIVTGANCGIGYETALDFAKRGARVILACRNKEKAEEAREKIVRETDNPNVYVKILDLCSFDSVRKFADDINKTEENWDILVNNAGAGGYGEERTEDGHLLLMQSNYYGPYLLTRLLVDHALKSNSSHRRRIVNVASIAARWSKVDVDALEVFFRRTELYGRTKLCNVLFTIELARRLRGSNITTYSVHPGVIKSELFRRMRPWMLYITHLVGDLFLKTTVEGAQTNIYCSLAKGIESLNGEHFQDCHYLTRYSSASDITLAKNLWEKTEEIIGLS